MALDHSREWLPQLSIKIRPYMTWDGTFVDDRMCQIKNHLSIVLHFKVCEPLFDLACAGIELSFYSREIVVRADGEGYLW